MIKKLILSILTVITIISAVNAQFKFNNIFFEGKIGRAKPLGSFSEYAEVGITYSLEVGYHISERIALGLGKTKMATLGFDPSLKTGILGINLHGLSSYYAKTWYTLLEGTVKPYIALGLGIGRSQISNLRIDVPLEVTKKTDFAAHAELGLILGGFNLSYSFNYNGKTPKGFDYNPSTQDLPIIFHRASLGYRFDF